MTSLSTFAFVLALAAVVFAVVAWITSWIRERELTLRLTTSSESFARQLAQLEKKTPASLAAEVAALSESVTRIALTQRRFAGRFDQFAARETKLPLKEETADEVRQRLRAEHGLPKMGGPGTN